MYPNTVTLRVRTSAYEFGGGGGGEHDTLYPIMDPSILCLMIFMLLCSPFDCGLHLVTNKKNMVKVMGCYS